MSNFKRETPHNRGTRSVIHDEVVITLPNRAVFHVDVRVLEVYDYWWDEALQCNEEEIFEILNTELLLVTDDAGEPVGEELTYSLEHHVDLLTSRDWIKLIYH